MSENLENESGSGSAIASPEEYIDINFSDRLALLHEVFNIFCIQNIFFFNYFIVKFCLLLNIF